MLKHRKRLGCLKRPSLGYVSPKYCTASSSAAAQNFQTVTTPPELTASSTAALLKMDSRPALPNDGRSLSAHVKKVKAEYWARDNLYESEVEKMVINLAEDSSLKED